jgi:Spy/CpxP family protein refolding chaperone
MVGNEGCYQPDSAGARLTFEFPEGIVHRHHFIISLNYGIFRKGEKSKMKKQGSKFIIAVAMIMVFMGAGLSYAQTKDAPEQARARRNKTIFDYKVQLQLTDNQVRGIKKILVDLRRQSEENRARLVLLDADIRDLVDKEGDLPVIKNKLNERAGILTTMTYQDIISARKINKVLTPEQERQWKEIKSGKDK